MTSHVTSRAEAPTAAGSAAAATYWPEIDGLRTLAVVAVLLFHLHVRCLAGGFVGVDVFFALSGFLITDILIRRHGHQGSDILWFYQRRIARIAPAAFLTIAASLLGGALVYSQEDLASLGLNSLAAATSAINVKLALQESYFQLSADSQPLHHYWSLALEEQFYLLFPPVLYLVLERSRQPAAVLWVLAAASFLFCVALTPVNDLAAFYLLPTRAWEFLAGAALAAARRDGKRPGSVPARLAINFGVALVVAAFFLVPSSGFPGWMAALPVAGTALVLTGVGSGGPFSRLLASPFMTAIGKRSYSLYLWHWPVFSFVDYGLCQQPFAIRLALKLGLTVAATLAGYAWVECPLRTSLGMRAHRRVTFAAFALAVAALATAGYLVRYHNYVAARADNVAGGGAQANPEGRLGSVVMVGDSLASMYGAQLASLANRMDFRLHVLSVNGRNELPGEPDTLWPKAVAFVSRERPDVVVIAERWTVKLDDGGAGLSQAIAALLASSGHVVILTEPPVPPNTASRAGLLAGSRGPYFPDPDMAKRWARTEAIIKTLAGPKVGVVDIRDAFLNPDGSLRLLAPNGRMAFQDSDHLTGWGIALVRPRLAAALRPWLRTARPLRRHGVAAPAAP